MSSDESNLETLASEPNSDPKNKKQITCIDGKDDGSNPEHTLESSNSQPISPVGKRNWKRKFDTTNSISEESEVPKSRRGKKLMRIKQKATSGGVGVGSDVEIIQNTPEKRGKLKKVMRSKDLLKSTRQAGKEEEERRKRVLENQKLYNESFLIATAQDSKVEQLVLDFNKSTKEPLISVDHEICKQLKLHQAKGIKFMWDACYESVETMSSGNAGGGCVLAHCMGLGKTLQVIAFLHTVMNKPECNTKLALVICPINTVGNWFNEIRHWCEGSDYVPKIHKLWEFKGNHRFPALEDWKKMGGIAIINYDAFRVLTSVDEEMTNRIPQRDVKTALSCLCDPGPDIVICDEGHILKNPSAQQTKAVSKIRTARRIVLTGTPLQNNLMEYYTMVSFVKPNLLGTKKKYQNRFGNPIARGQHKDSEDFDVKLMKRRAYVLHKLLDGCVQRMDYSVLTPFLPPKLEYAICIELSPIQNELTAYYLKNVSKKSLEGKLKSVHLLCDYQALVKVWAHPKVLTMERKNSDKSGGDSGDALDVGNSVTDDKNRDEVSKQDEDPLPVTNSNWYEHVLNNYSDGELEDSSGKMRILLSIIHTCVEIGDKLLVFSSFITTLDLIEDTLMLREENSKKSGYTTSPDRWRPAIEYFRIDGKTRSETREAYCHKFNTSSRAKLFLISTKAGGLGINLTGANRVVIFDASWNPSNDIQSIFRVFRFGQKKPCYVYRLLARGTMEERIYNRQVVKLSLSCRVVDDQQVERHFRFDEIEDMYKFDPNGGTERPTPIVPKDPLLADLLINQKDWIFNYHEHDSLLENMEAEELTEEERRAAWDEYKNEDKLLAKSQPEKWTLTIMNGLRQKYPEKTEADLMSIYQQVCGEFIVAQNYFTKLAQEYSSTAREQWQRKFSDHIAKIKSHFPDNKNWEVLFNSNRVNNLAPKPRNEEAPRRKLGNPSRPSTSSVPQHFRVLNINK